MNFEINLVKTDSIYSAYGRILARHRATIDNDTEAIAELTKFLAENISDIDAAISDKNLVAKIEHIQGMTVDEFECLRYTLAENGIDIRYWAVSDVEGNGTSIAEGSLEYNIVDNANHITSFVPFCTKLVVDVNQGSVSAIYRKIVEMYGLFGSKLFAGRVNTLINNINVMQSQEAVTGFVPTELAQHANAILEFMGKTIFVIAN